MTQDGVRIWIEHIRDTVPSKTKPGKVEYVAKGGKTIVKLLGETDDDVLAVGEAVCSPVDNYNRKLGVMIALGRAQKALRLAAAEQ